VACSGLDIGLHLATHGSSHMDRVLSTPRMAHGDKQLTQSLGSLAQPHLLRSPSACQGEIGSCLNFRRRVIQYSNSAPSPSEPPDFLSLSKGHSGPPRKNSQRFEFSMGRSMHGRKGRHFRSQAPQFLKSNRRNDGMSGVTVRLIKAAFKMPHSMSHLPLRT
jgi:hypothetical protein